jgi:hypothetical protein
VSYDKQTWADGIAGGTPITADRLAHIEDGIEDAAAVADAAAGAVAGKADVTYVDALGSYAATGNNVARRNVNGDIQFSRVYVANAPAQTNEATRKDYVDAIGVTDGTPNRVVRTDASGDIYGRAHYASKTPPTLSSEVTRKDYVDTADANVKAAVEGYKAHDGSAGGGTRPTGFARVRWVGGTVRPTNMAAGDIWEHDA